MSKKTEHTSGPWKFDDELFIFDSRENNMIAEMRGYGAKYPMEANAQRIIDCVNACEGINPQAVPDMLEALKNAYAILDILKETPELFTEEMRHENCLLLMKQAIAKATGKVMK